jgi:hypothetical protein
MLDDFPPPLPAADAEEEAWAPDGGGDNACDEHVRFDAPYLWYDLAADARVEHDDGSDRFFDVFHPEHEPPGPPQPAQRLIPAEDDENGFADELARASLGAGFAPAAWRDAAPAPSPRALLTAPRAKKPRAGSVAGLRGAASAEAASPSPQTMRAAAGRAPGSSLRAPPDVGPSGTVVRGRALREVLPHEANAAAAPARRPATAAAAARECGTDVAAAGKRARAGGGIGAGIGDDTDLKRLLMQHNIKVRRQASGRAPADAGAPKSRPPAPVAEPLPPPPAAAPISAVAAASAPAAAVATSARKQPATASAAAAAPPPKRPATAAATAARGDEAGGGRRGSGGGGETCDAEDEEEEEDAASQLRAMLLSHNARVRAQKRAGAGADVDAPRPPSARAPAAPVGIEAVAAGAAARRSAGAQPPPPRRPPAPSGAQASAPAAPARPRTAAAATAASVARRPAKTEGVAPASEAPARALRVVPPARPTAAPISTAASRTEILGDCDLLALLRQHNSKFNPKPVRARAVRSALVRTHSAAVAACSTAPTLALCPPAFLPPPSLDPQHPTLSHSLSFSLPSTSQVYEPRQHSVKAVKEWERESGRRCAARTKVCTGAARAALARGACSSRPSTPIRLYRAILHARAGTTNCPSRRVRRPTLRSAPRRAKSLPPTRSLPRSEH